MSRRDTQVEPVGVGDVRMVRTFRLSEDGGLFPVNSRQPWTDGWNTATCRRRRGHTAPAAGCRCGFYAYSDPAYAFSQPPAWQLLAVVAARGQMELGTRGGRVQQARIEALWLGSRVSEQLAAKVRQRYPTVLTYRDQSTMLADVPLTELPTFTPPRWHEGARRRARAVLLAYLLVAAVAGCAVQWAPPSVGLSASCWILLAVGLLVTAAGLATQASMVALIGVTGISLLLAGSVPSDTAAWVYRLLITATVGWACAVWLRAAVPGRPLKSTVPDWLRPRWRGRMQG